ncbi:MAG: bifunctional [glutamate--ammonia ligase]-adenylyl-L-tyrosine phosphorylase/[glutamate--ammonia-ligase] adenylyltransferase [Burkholderiales bacterium]
MTKLEASRTNINACEFSRYVAFINRTQPDLVRQATSADDLTRITDFYLSTDSVDEQKMLRNIRLARHATMTRCVHEELRGTISIVESMKLLSTFADTILSHVTKFYENELEPTFGHPVDEDGERVRLNIVAMGKLGGSELNFSSDIDLIFLYPKSGNTTGNQRISNHEYFLKLSQKIIQALTLHTENGFVFRVDTRLRPYGIDGPLAMSFDMLEEYFYSQGRPWERFAWAKARSVYGQQIDLLTKMVNNFVYRSYVDYVVIDNLRQLHRMIRERVKKKGLESDIKLGAGGIREIEFIAQVSQLIHGGQDRTLRSTSTVETLKLLEQKNILKTSEVSALLEAYFFLRMIEHRIQYLDDQQTHKIPKDKEDQLKIAKSLNFDNWDSLSATLNEHLAFVHKTFINIFEDSSADRFSDRLNTQLIDLNNEQLLDQISTYIWNEYPNTSENIFSFVSTSKFRRLPAVCQEKLDLLIPSLLKIIPHNSEYEKYISRLLTILDAIAWRETYLSLLIEYPSTRDQLIKILQSGQWATNYLARYPGNLEQLIVSVEELSASALMLDEVPARATQTDEIEEAIDIIHRYKQKEIFKSLLMDLFEIIDLRKLSDRLSDVADQVVTSTLELAVKTLGIEKEACKLAVVGMGKLGSREIGYESDLDLIFLYEPVNPDDSLMYSRIVQKVNALINSASGHGTLFKTDLRLRPFGQSGLLVSSLESFQNYQQNQAKTWEHQALTRGRGICGDKMVLGQFESIRGQVMKTQRERSILSQSILDMRRLMDSEFPPKPNVFDLKRDAGGIIDIEFIVQFIVLLHANKYPELSENIGNIALLTTAADEGLVPLDAAAAVGEAYYDYRKLQHAQRLQGVQRVVVPDGDLLSHRKNVISLWETLFQTQRI